jgi:hypothetical protein
MENRRFLFLGTLIYERCLTITTSDHARQGRSSLKGASDLPSSVERGTDQANGFLTRLADPLKQTPELTSPNCVRITERQPAACPQAVNNFLRKRMDTMAAKLLNAFALREFLRSNDSSPQADTARVSDGQP